MSVEATSSGSSASISFTPAGDDPPKVEDNKKDPKKELDQSAAANSPAPTTHTRNVVVFAAKVTREGGGRDVAQAVGATVVGTACGFATKTTLDGAGSALGPVGKTLVSMGSTVAGAVVGLGCAPAGSQAGGAVYDAATGGPNKIQFEARTITVEVPASPEKADTVKAPTTNASGAPVDEPSSPATKSADAARSQPAASKPTSAAPAPNASTLPYTPALASSAWSDPSASYLRPAAAK